MNPDSWLTAGSLALGVVGFVLDSARRVRKDKRARLAQLEIERNAAIDAATETAVAPLHARITDLQTANRAALDMQADIWKSRVTDRDQTIAALTAERNHYRDLWDARSDGVSLQKPPDPPE